MHDFVSHVLRKYWEATDWNGFNSYLHLTSTSAAVLDFPIPSGLSFSISASPSPPFFTTYRLRVLPSLSGALGYIFASTDPQGKGLDISKGSKETRLKDFVERFRILETPRRPGLGRWPVYLGGKRVEGKDYLLFGCMHVPSARLDALYTTRLSPTWQLLVTAVSIPAKSNSFYSHHQRSDRSSSASDMATSGNGGGGGSNSTPPPPPPPPQPQSSGLGQTNLQFMLQQDTGRWFTEYSYSADDALWGLRVLHNFGTPSGAPGGTSAQNGEVDSQSTSSGINAGSSGNSDFSPSISTPAQEGEKKRSHRVDEESALEAVVGGGLQGRFSAGAELFFSAAEKSAGISTGIRFTTLSEPSSSSAPSATGTAATASDGPLHSQDNPSQPPTTITATLNPMMGHLSTAYAAKMTRDIVACSRFDFNVYSYDSELTLGAEYWLRSSPTPASAQPASSDAQRLSGASQSAAGPSSSPAASTSTAATTTWANLSGTVDSATPAATTAASGTAEEPMEAIHVTREPVAKPPHQGLSLRDGRSVSIPSPSINSSANGASASQGAQSGGDASTMLSLRETQTQAQQQPFEVAGLREEEVESAKPLSGSKEEVQRVSPSSRDSGSFSSPNSLSGASSSSSNPQQTPPGGVIGVIKARLSTTGDVALLWEGRLRNCLVSFGVRADLSSRTLGRGGGGGGGGSGGKKRSTTNATPSSAGASPMGSRPLKGIGLDVLYFSSTEKV